MAHDGRVDCQRCRHFYVTYQMPRPYACRHFGFESVRLPSLEVLASSGEACRAYEARPTGRGPAPGARSDDPAGHRGTMVDQTVRRAGRAPRDRPDPR